MFCVSHLSPDRHGHEDYPLVVRDTFRGRNLRILPLGASITAGRGSSTGNGYRKDLQDRLEGDGNNVTYVGTRFYGTMADNACEAYPGYTIERVDNATRESGALLFLPNIVLINLGTNNCVVKNQDPEGAPARYKQLLDHIRDVVPSALVVVSSLVHNRDPVKDACIVTLNAGLQRVANEARSFGQKVAFVDMYDAVPLGDIGTWYSLQTEGSSKADMCVQTRKTRLIPETTGTLSWRGFGMMALLRPRVISLRRVQMGVRLWCLPVPEAKVVGCKAEYGLHC